MERRLIDGQAPARARADMKVLLQTTIPRTTDDWHIGRFSRLHKLIESMPGLEVVARDRARDGGSDPLLSDLANSDFEQLWLFGVDGGNGLTEKDCAGITAFARSGRGILATRDHQDCGSSICNLGGVGGAHFFHSQNPDPDPARRRRDDENNTTIDWPNFHSGANGDYQRITVAHDHPLFRRTDGTRIEWFPAHPHEGAVGVPPGDWNAQVLATGTSRVTGIQFPLVVALEATAERGRALAHSSFHHFVDYNWDTQAGCPSFVAEAPGNEIARDGNRLNDVKTYVRNAVTWLSKQRGTT